MAARRRPQVPPAPPRASRRTPRLWLLAIAVAGVLAYANSLSNPLVLDDTLTILDNPQIREWWRPGAVLFPERELPVAGRPFVNVTFAINYALHGTDLPGYHAVNILVHVLCALAAFGLMRRSLELPSMPGRVQRRAVGIAGAVALLWAVHPLNTEVINYLTQRTESMMALCFLMTMYASVRALNGSPRWHVAAVVACALGMACKESMVTVPVMIVLFDRLFVFASLKDAFRRRGIFYAALASTWLLLLALNWSGPRIHSAGFGTDVSVWTYLLNQTEMIVRYLRLAVWPAHLVVNYGWPRPVTVADVWPYAALVSLLGLVTLAALRDAPRLAFLGAWFFITLSPTTSIVPIATEVGAERRMYLPLLAVLLLAVVGAMAVWDRWLARGEGEGEDARARTAGMAVTIAVAVALAAGTLIRNREYSSSLRLSETTVQRWPSPVAHHVLAFSLLEAGRQDDALKELSEAIPGAPRAYYTLGEMRSTQGRDDEAIAAMQEFIRLLPEQAEVPDAHLLMARIHLKRGQWDDAVTQSREAARKALRKPEPRRVLADALFGKQSFAEAITAYRVYLGMRPADGGALANLGIALAGDGKLDEAIEVFRHGVAIDPNNGMARRNLATALYDGGKLDDAARELRAAIALRPTDSFLHMLLGQTLARQGHAEEGLAMLERAVQLDPADADARQSLMKLREALRR